MVSDESDGDVGGPRDEAALIAWFDAAGPVTVAFSGGVDSTLVLAAAVRALGAADVLAITAVSASVASGAAQAAQAIADGLGVTHRTVETAELDAEGYRRNAGDRCYFCKSALLDALGAAEVSEQGRLVLTGTNADDVRAGWRPGIRAARERGARSPLADLGFSKQAVREVSRRWGLPTWDQPANPCLSSRVAYGVVITPARLTRIDRAESALRKMLAEHGLSTFDLRVRDLGGEVRVEVDADLVDLLDALPEVPGVLAGAGFATEPVTVDAFRSGTLNSALPESMRYA
jgi:uncharacterized protein